jgi:hypothetical protein
MAHLCCNTTGLVVLLGFVGELFLDTTIKDGVKAQFDRQLESHKVALELSGLHRSSFCLP